MSPLLLVTGTGTGIGKTSISEALLLAWRSRGRIAGVKPIESGADPSGGDGARLEQASTFHVTRSTSPYLLEAPVSPHLAARLEGRAIDVAVIADWVASLRRAADGVLVELAGGLFSPITDSATNAELANLLRPTRILLVAPDRLGVLHDVIATTRAARASELHLDGIILSAPAEADASTGTNAHELARLLLGDPPVLASVPRAGPAELAALLAPILSLAL